MKADRTAKIKTIQTFVKEYKDETSFMIESLVENVQREDLSSMETAKFIKKIWNAMGKPTNLTLGKLIGLSERAVWEHLSLVADKTPKEVKKAVEEGKLAMRSASMISKLPEKKQIEIAKESMKEETGIGRSKIEEKIKEHKIIAGYGVEEDEKTKKGYEGVTLNIFLNKEEKQATIKACEKEKLQMEILVKKNHLDWLKKEKYL